MSRRLAAYSIVSIVIVYSFVQFNSYFVFDSVPTELPNDRQTLVVYLLVLFGALVSQYCLTWYQQHQYQKAKLLGHATVPRSSRLIHYEYRVFETTLSLSKIAKILSLFILNGWIKTGLPIHSLHEDPMQVMAHRSAQLALANMAISVGLSAKLSWLHQTMAWHAWFGRLACFQVMTHVTWQLQQLYDRSMVINVRHLSGLSMVSALCLLLFGSHPLVRALSYRLFRVTHLVAFFMLILLGCLHDVSFVLFYAAVTLFWVTDQLNRSFRTESVSVEPLAGDIVRIRCQVPYTYDAVFPGQFAFVSFDSSWWRAWFHSHPFSIARHSTGDEQASFVFYAKVKGKDTRALYDTPPDQKMMARLSKPLGYPFVTFLGDAFGDYETVVLVAEGVGITPWLLLFQYMQEKQHAVKTRQIHLVWSIHTIDTFYAFESEFHEFLETIQLDLSIQLYITGPCDPEEQDTIPDFNIEFKHGIRPNYPQLFDTIDNNTATVLGVCAHPSTMVTTNNAALLYGWSVRKERFEL
ncbi:hypothetical protein BD560DRAFT_434715 [Blakeslea trispora]|nr:hypothetical protein BD560DRAFT_434715 [Blakeslea trispora]